LPAFAWRDWGKPRKTSFRIAGLRADYPSRKSLIRRRSANHSKVKFSLFLFSYPQSFFSYFAFCYHLFFTSFPFLYILNFIAFLSDSSFYFLCCHFIILSYFLIHIKYCNRKGIHFRILAKGQSTFWVAAISKQILDVHSA
jgi:hypothetical protein